jgi:hypothetical protein
MKEQNCTSMKMRSALFVGSFLLVGFCSMAQKARLEGGINLANVTISDNGKIDDAKMLSSFQVGIIGDFPLTGVLYLQPGLLFTGKGTKTQSGDPASSLYSKATTNPYYVELPVNLVFKTPVGSGTHASENRFFVGAGPYLAAGVSGKIKNEGTIGAFAYNNERNIEFSNDDPTTLDYEEGAGFGIMKRFDYGLNGTAGLEGKTLVLSVNYGFGLAKLQSGSNSAEDNNNKHRVLSFTIGFKL